MVCKLLDTDLVAPKPNPNGYGSLTDAQSLEQLKNQAAQVLDGQELLFTMEQEFLPGSEILTYLDDSILVITWKAPINKTVYTFSEVKIQDGSQLRRFLAGGVYGSEKQLVTTDMAKSVNAVVASSGDFYKCHYHGVIVYENTVRQVHFNRADSCLIDEDGSLHFLYQSQKLTPEEAQEYVDENHIRFSLAFGPVLVDDYKPVEIPFGYELGQTESYSSRAALCQLGRLHYLLVTANPDNDSGNPQTVTLKQFAKVIASYGPQMAYTLDGGQTAAIAMNGELVNPVLFGRQIETSDIIYFATAIPDGT